jgi:cellulose 1,4-beta-cellobiosidase
LQGGKIIANSKTNMPCMKADDSITTQFCADQKVVFGDVDDFKTKGGFGPMSTAMGTGMVLVVSIWDGHAANTFWLDSNDEDASTSGVARGACPTISGFPAHVESQPPDAAVTYSNLEFGPTGSICAR